MKNRPFGLDIGASTMKAVWLADQKDGYMLTAASILPTPSKGMSSESPLDQEEMAQAVHAIVTEAKITTQYVNVALPENQVYTRVLEMPVLSDKELSSAIYWEAEQYIPVPLPTVTMSWKVLSRPAQNEVSGKMQVLLVGAPTSLINKYQKIINLAGLTPIVMETEILAILRSVVVGENFPNSIVIHMGGASTLLAIVKGGTVIFLYVIPIGGIAITRAIAGSFGFSSSQAEEYKRVYGYSSKTLEGKIGKTAEPILTSILTEVKKAVTFYTERYKNEAPLTQIILSGGTAKLPGIDLFFASSIGIETVRVSPWKILVPQEIPKEILDNAPDYTIAVGLAMRSI